MDLLYGSDGTNYRVIARSQDLSPGAAQLLVNSYLAYYPVRNRMPYSRPEYEPESIYYVTSDLGGELAADTVILAKNGRMTRTPSPSTYMHVHLENAGGRYFRDGFFDIFRIGFIKDTEIRLFAQGSLDSYVPGKPYSFSENAVDREKLRAVLMLLFDRNRLGHPVRIILDESGDGYNRRARELLFAVYHYLPYDMRRRIGFATYMDENQSGLPRVFLQLFDRSQLKEPARMDLDLGSFDASQVRAGIRKQEIPDYVDYLTSMGPEERADYFDELEQVFGSSRMNVDDLLSYDTANRSWRGRSEKELLPLWVDYVFENGLMGGTVYNLLKKNISSRLDNGTYNDYLFSLMEREQADLLALPENVRRTVIMADELEDLVIDSDRMQDYYRVHVILPRKAEGGETSASVLEEAAALDALDIGSPHFHELMKDIAEGRRRDAIALKTEEEKRRPSPDPERSGAHAGTAPSAEVKTSRPVKKQTVIEAELAGPQGLLALLREASPYLNSAADSDIRFHLKLYDIHTGEYPVLKMKVSHVKAFLEFLLVPVESTYRRFLEAGCPREAAPRVRELEYLSDARLFHSGHAVYLERLSRELPGVFGEKVRRMADRARTGQV